MRGLKRKLIMSSLILVFGFILGFTFYLRYEIDAKLFNKQIIIIDKNIDFDYSHLDIPYKYRKDIDVIRIGAYDFSDKLIRILYHNSDGVYYYPYVISSIRFSNINELTLWHEIGHSVWYNLLNEYQKEQWEKEFKTSMIYVSDYAIKNSHEDFAESFARFIEYGCYNLDNCVECPGTTRGRLKILCEI